ncbi:lipid IV(A) 3-deoxy-D-manno-octulosonic acid transferase [Thalassotalea fonticola]|uniref:3-deoxy-D-manno-octulosonic acid transferase n=1 Tax=Thalassotalea fonticola TaxID=3065649 RepID=A0ABZ0GMT4_9GAMM|nr:lipid IV(A) 3-deoxy-D-manno-octulosonic acid transferase [Colwelliaceae bacterium S1-1]
MNKQKLSLRLYQLVIMLITPILILVFLIRSLNHKEYRQRLSERFGWTSSNLKPGGIVVHAASVGEVIAVTPFVEELLVQQPDLPITVTTFTPTGSAQVIKSFQNRVQHCYLPLDISFCVHLFFKFLKPKAVVLMETEIWPTLIQRCHKSGVKLLLINGRLSGKSLKSYKKISWLIKPALNKFSAILCQSEDNLENFIHLGAKPEILSNSGNLKYDISITDDVQNKISKLQQCIANDRTIMVVGSTHQGEEIQLINAFKRLKENHQNLLLVLVPRHPERFSSVGKICQEQELNVVTRSSKQQVNAEHDVWLIDTLGELLPVYALADICIVAGSFSDVGGHNPLEAALFSKPILVGENMANFKDINAKFIAAKAIVQLKDNLDLTAELSTLIDDQALCIELGKNAEKLVKSNQGATVTSANTLKSLINI